MSTLIGSYTWVDTRDMVADGLTKGRADRTPLAAIMSGSYILNHVCHEYKEPTTTTTGQYMQREAVVASSPRRPDASAASDETEGYFIHEVCSSTSNTALPMAETSFATCTSYPRRRSQSLSMFGCFGALHYKELAARWRKPVVASSPRVHSTAEIMTQQSLSH